jgi:hypothetical protein
VVQQAIDIMAAKITELQTGVAHIMGTTMRDS